MKRLFFLSMLIAGNAQAQTTWLPPVSFPASNICDPAPWKLVLYDHFNSPILNTNNWDSYLRGGTNNNEDWSGARASGGNDWRYVDLDKNVVLTSGVCKLQSYHEPVNWNCPSCPPNATRYYSSATLTTPYFHGTPPSMQANYFNSGKFEFRTKIPFAPGIHTTFWTWGASVNEIDIAETKGTGSLNSTKLATVLHAWKPAGTNTLPDNAYITNQYPGQNWYDYYFNTNFNFSDWHTYTCEWDTTSIKIELDHNIVQKFWKYYRMVYYPVMCGYFQICYIPVNVGSGCNVNGNYRVTYGYPYQNHSLSNFRITSNFDGTFDPVGDYTNSSTFLGETTIDYVKIWQRHPEADNHTDLCALPVPTLTGPSIIYGNTPSATYTVSTLWPGGHWDFSSNLAGYTSGNSVIVHRIDNGSGGEAYVRYYFSEACEPNYVEKYVFLPFKRKNNQGELHLMVVNSQYPNGLSQFRLFDGTYLPESEEQTTRTKFEWSIDLNTQTGSQHFDAHGQYVATPMMETQDAYELNWQLTITDPDGGITTKSGVRTNADATGLQADPDVQYYDAQITDPDAYDQAVIDRLSQKMISEKDAVDTPYVYNLIEKARADELEPYIVSPAQPKQGNTIANTVVNTSMQHKATVIYPNPAKSQVTIAPGDAFRKDADVSLTIYDLMGRKVKSLTAPCNDNLQLDINDLPDNLYILEIKQDNKKAERIKFRKQSRL